MVEQELKNIWKNSSQVEKIKFDLSRLIMELDGEMNRIEKVIRKRDLREILASIAGIPIFVYLTYEVPYPISKAASALTLTWFIYVIYKFKSVQKSRIPEDLTLSFSQQLENQKLNMLAQHNLLNTVLYWYVLPPFILNMVFIWGLGYPDSEATLSGIMEYLPTTLEGQMTFTIGLMLFNAFVVWLNKKAVKQTLNPLIAEIERIQNQLQKED